MIRRRLILTAAPAALLLPRPTAATAERVASLIRDFAAGSPILDGHVKLDLPVLVENGNSVAMTLAIDRPTREIAVFADGNPNPEVLRLRFGPAAGQPRIGTRIRLATSQTVTAIARLHDGTCRADKVELLVTLAACIE